MSHSARKTRLQRTSLSGRRLCNGSGNLLYIAPPLIDSGMNKLNIHRAPADQDEKLGPYLLGQSNPVCKMSHPQAYV